MATEADKISSEDIKRPLFQDSGALKLTELEDDNKDLVPPRERELIKGLRSDRMLRVWMAGILTVLFVVLNGFVVWMVWDAVQADRALIAAAKITTLDQRVITQQVYLALIGGTVIEVAAIVLVIARYLFPTRTESEN